MTDMNHKVSKALVRQYGAGTLFVLEDLTGVRNKTDRIAAMNLLAKGTTYLKEVQA